MTCLLDNNTYNLMIQLIEESQSLWRIKKYYIKDASECEKCLNLWKKLEKDKQEHIEDLEELVKNHLG